jgi:60 kDa SS-A/Ro ribonucleoprotein
MTKFSTKAEGRDQTINMEGAPAFKLDPKLKLYSRTATSLVEPQFYTPDVKDQLTSVRALVKMCPPEFVAKLAVYIREEMYLRSIPLVLLVELIKAGGRGQMVSRAVERCIQRPDELYEILSYFIQANERGSLTKQLNKMPKILLAGLRKAFLKFDEYQFAKYDRPTGVRLRDVLFLCHAKPSSGVRGYLKKERKQGVKQPEDPGSQLFKKITDQILKTPYTWETVLSDKGNTKEVWEELIDSKKVGYMALLRNLRNILKANVSDQHLGKVLTYLSSRDAVLRAKQLPYRYISAYQELAGEPSWNLKDVEAALEVAMRHSAENIAGFDSDTKVLICCDMSGSMQNKISEKSKILLQDVGLVLGMMLQFKCRKVLTGIFGETFEMITLPSNDILKNALAFIKMNGRVGHSTNGWKILDYCINRKLEVDKMCFFTDCEWWDSEPGWGESHKAAAYWREYKKLFPKAKCYYFNLAGYGTTPISTKAGDVKFISGFSDRVFNVLEAIEKGLSAIVEIEAIEI